MKNLHITFLLFLITQVLHGQIVINELDADTVGTDTMEFIELRSDNPNTALDDYVVVLFNGSVNGDDRSYYVIDLDGYSTDINGLFLIGGDEVTPIPQLLLSTSVIQNGADAVAIYEGSIADFPDDTLATTTNLIDALIYDTDDADDMGLMTLLGISVQINENENGNKTTESIQRNNDGSYFVGPPTPRQLNDGSGIVLNGVSIHVDQEQYNEGDSFTIEISTEQNVDNDLPINITLNNDTFDNSDFSGDLSLVIPQGQNSINTMINLIDDPLDEGDEVLLITVGSLPQTYLNINNNIEVRIVDNDFQVAAWGTPINPTYNVVNSTQPAGYYSSMEGLSGSSLRQAMQDIISDENVVRAQTYADVIDIVKEADQNPENSNQIWMVYTEQGRAKLDFQNTSDNTGKWNREHTYPRSRGGFFNIDGDNFSNGIDIFWQTHADSTRHGNSDAHGIRAADGVENSARSNLHYGQYNGPTGNLGSFKGDVARAVFFLAVRYNDVDVVNGFPDTVGELGDLSTLLNWHRNDPPDDYEMNRNNIVYTWQFNRNPFIDHPELIEYIWGVNVGDPWSETLSTHDNALGQINIYPNPSSGTIHIRGIHQPTKIFIYSLDGKLLVKKLTLSDISISQDIGNGVYFIKLISGSTAVQKKIVLKK